MECDFMTVPYVLKAEGNVSCNPTVPAALPAVSADRQE